MKHTIVYLAFTLTSINAYAQHPDTIARPDTGKKAIHIRICVPPKGTLLKPPLYVIHTHKRTFIAPGDSMTLNTLDPKSIESINILKGAEATSKYGDAGKNGVIDLVLKDKPKDTYNKLKQLAKQGKIRVIK